jgi:two-component system OmpR family sensor kinase
MSRILADLLLLSQVDSRLILELAPVDLVTIVRSIAEHERSRFPGREIKLESADAPLLVEADDQRVRQIIENLVENAARYSTPGMPITISVQRNGRFAIAEVRDQGPGMSEDETKRAFERFFRGSRSRRQHADGSGLGLAIVRHIAEAHGGGVALTSTPAGTTVKVELPLAPAKP